MGASSGSFSCLIGAAAIMQVHMAWAAANLCPPQLPADPQRRSATVPTLPYEPTPCNPSALAPAPSGTLGDAQGLPDRWRIASLLGFRENLRDPYHGNNRLKGDRPIFGEDWFMSVLGVSDSMLEPRRFPTPVGSAVTQDPGELDAFGAGRQLLLSQSFVLETVLYKGNTVFQPPDYEFRFTPVLNINYADVRERGVLRADPSRGTQRTDAALGVQALFVDKHLRNVSANYDFDSLRVGLQPFTSDFRGFLFQDAPLGVRVFGTRANNRYQYNLAWLRRIDKDINSGLNDLIEHGAAALRHDDLWVANVYAQDTPWPGFTAQTTAVYNRNREGARTVYDDNGVLQRPASIGLERGSDYDVTYLGVSGDGHVRRWNVTATIYGAFGRSDHGLFVERPQRIQAAFAAAEVSRDFSWMRARLSLAYASADHDPFDGRATGFDAIFENPLFAGADTSFWIRQPVPLVGGGRVSLSGRNGMLNSLRSSKELGQSNFTNPGLLLAGAGLDMDLLPTLRVSANANYLAFVDTNSLQVARGQSAIRKPIGLDASIGLTWRPLAIQNLVLRLSGAALLPGSGYRDLFGSRAGVSILGNAVVSY